MFVFVSVFLLFIHSSASWQVLIANVLATKSHQTTSVYLSNLLSQQGHSVTYLSTNLPTTLHESVDKRDLPTCTHVMNNLGGDREDGIQKIFTTIDTLLRACERWYTEPNVKALLETKTKYDLMITFGLFDSCSLALATHLGINNTIVHMSFPALIPNHVTMLGLPLYSSSVDINDILIRDHELVKNSALSRAKNLLKRLFFEVLYTGLTNWYIEPVLKNNIPEYQGYYKSYETVKLVTMHTHPHPDIDGPTPFGPGVLTLGGSLCTKYDYAELSASPGLAEFVDSATDGFIYVSFGSVQQDVSPEEQAKWVETFSKLPYKVVWKQSESVVSLPENTRTFPWLAQMSLLQHPNIRLFITHGGYASKLEATCAGVPLLVVPKFAADQFYTAERFTKLGLGEQILDLESSSVSEIRSKILHITGTDSFHEKMGAVKRQLHLTKMTDRQVLGYIDAVVGGHSFLPGYQPWYQYFYLDIILVPVIIILLTKYLFRKLFFMKKISN
ncbi:hypothetical protein ACHWQZ_G003883 [Mnemiopsis leidyi]